MHQGVAVDDPPGSRLFIVCGRSVEEETLRAAFRPYGMVQNVKVIREKGVAYVKFDKASSAALAMESLNGAVLNNGRGPKLKVLMAEAPAPKGMQMLKPPMEDQLSSDPDNMPPRSRLFLVVPKTAEARIIQEEAGRYPDLEYCKTDLVSSKGVAFCKYAKASSALTALEDISSKGMLGPYKVKIMLAEPKTKRNKLDALNTLNLFTPQGKLDLTLNTLGLDQSTAFRLAAATNSQFPGFNFGAPGAAAGMLGQQGPGGLGHGVIDYSALAASQGSLQGLAGLGVGPGGVDISGQQFGGFSGLNALAPSSTPDSSIGAALSNTLSGFHSSPSPGNGSMNSGASSLSTMNFPMNFMGLGSGLQMAPGGHQVMHQGPGLAGAPALSKQRLFVVVHKSVTDEVLQRLFRQYPGMEYCDLKKDRATQKSKGYCYVNYSTPVAAAAAVAELNGIEFPPSTGYRIKVMYAEMLASGGGSSASSTSSSAMRGGGNRGNTHHHPGAAAAAAAAAGQAVAAAAGPVSGPGPGGGLQQGVLSSQAPSPSHSRLGPGSIGGHEGGLAMVQESLSNMSLPRLAETAVGVSGGPEVATSYDLAPGPGSGGINTSPVNHQVARELMFSVGA